MKDFQNRNELTQFLQTYEWVKKTNTIYHFPTEDPECYLTVFMPPFNELHFTWFRFYKGQVVVEDIYYNAPFPQKNQDDIKEEMSTILSDVKRLKNSEERQKYQRIFRALVQHRELVFHEDKGYWEYNMTNGLTALFTRLPENIGIYWTMSLNQERTEYFEEMFEFNETQMNKFYDELVNYQNMKPFLNTWVSKEVEDNDYFQVMNRSFENAKGIHKEKAQDVYKKIRTVMPDEWLCHLYHLSYSRFPEPQDKIEIGIVKTGELSPVIQPFVDLLDELTNTYSFLSKTFDNPKMNMYNLPLEQLDEHEVDSFIKDWKERTLSIIGKRPY